MKLIFSFFLIFFTGTVLSESAGYSLVPVPAEIENDENGFFVLDGAITVAAAVPEAAFAADFLAEKTGAERVPAKGVPAKIVFEKLSVPAKIKNSREGYFLEIGSEKIVVRALDSAGFFYGAQTLLQLLDDEKTRSRGALETLKIYDYPRFRWRGVMLDSARHFQDFQWIKKFVDLLASQKINVFHWHLTDDQGWRVEIKKYPPLTETGAWRSGTGFGFSEESDKIHRNEKGDYGGFYTQEQIRELVAYARERNIVIVPEIELPGHALAALCAFPQLGCTGGPYEIWLRGGVSEDVFCAGNDEVFEFLENVFDEIAALFPSKFIHIGGDECPEIRWKNCPKCRKRIFDENLRGNNALQSYFINRAAKILAKKNKTPVGWDEILADDITPDAVVMSWRGNAGGIAAARRGHFVVMTPANYCYFDYSQARTGEPKSFGGLVPLKRAYAFDPTLGVPEDCCRKILGGQANLWSEYMPSETRVEYMLAPRISALAEAVWSPRERKNYDGFLKRMPEQYRRFEKAGWNYRKPEGIVFKLGEGTLVFDADSPDALIAYTLDGSVPDENSPRIKNLVPVTVPPGKFRKVRARVFLSDGTLGKINERRLDFPKAFVETALFPYQNFVPENAVDGDKNSFFWSDAAVPAGTTFTARFEKAKFAGKIKCITGKDETGGGGDKAENAVLEISSDGKRWQKIADFKNGTASAAVPAGTPVAAVRIRFLKSQDTWLVVREIEIE